MMMMRRRLRRLTFVQIVRRVQNAVSSDNCYITRWQLFRYSSVSTLAIFGKISHILWSWSSLLLIYLFNFFLLFFFFFAAVSDRVRAPKTVDQSAIVIGICFKHIWRPLSKLIRSIITKKRSTWIDVSAAAAAAVVAAAVAAFTPLAEISGQVGHRARFQSSLLIRHKCYSKLLRFFSFFFFFSFKYIFWTDMLPTSFWRVTLICYLSGT